MDANQAAQVVLGALPPIGARIETMHLADARQRILAHDALAQAPHPPFDAAIKDGFALRAADAPNTFNVAFACRAGQLTPRQLKPNEAAFVTTGAPLPPNTDCVVALESVELLEPPPPPSAAGKRALVNTAASARRIRVHHAVAEGDEVRRAGSDVHVGELLVPAGTRLGAAELGVLAGAGQSQVVVYLRPRVAVLSTGDEIVDIARLEVAHGLSENLAAALGPGCIFDTNRPTLLAAAEEEGALPVDLGIARDCEADVDAALQRAVDGDCDVLCCSGGVSMGDRDFLGTLLARHGTLHFDHVHMKPGKPLTFATMPRPTPAPPLLVFGLPGNPCSTLVCFQLFVAPLLRALQGAGTPLPRRIAVRLGETIIGDASRPEFHRVTLVARESGLDAHSTGRQISSRLASCVGAQALLELPPCAKPVVAGTRMTALLVPGISGAASHFQAPELDALQGLLRPLEAASSPESAVASSSTAPLTDAVPAGSRRLQILYAVHSPICHREATQSFEEGVCRAMGESWSVETGIVPMLYSTVSTEPVKWAIDQCEANVVILRPGRARDEPSGAASQLARAFPDIANSISDRNAPSITSVLRNGYMQRFRAHGIGTCSDDLELCSAFCRGRKLVLCLPANDQDANAALLAVRHLLGPALAIL